jgi:hypothetical protein
MSSGYEKLMVFGELAETPAGRAQLFQLHFPTAPGELSDLGGS